MDFYYPLAPTLLQKAQKISLLILDVDGVLSAVSYTHLTLPTTPYV